MRIVWMVGVCLLLAGAPADAQHVGEHGDAAFTHVRATMPQLQAIIADMAGKSPAFRAMLDRLEQSTVIVYVRTVPLPSSLLQGRTAFLKTDTPRRDRRVLVVELSCSLPLMAQTTALAHELRHALEIADAPWVVDPATLAQYYAQIGERVGATRQHMQFETLAAREAASQVRREVAAHHRRAARAAEQ